MTAQCPAVSPLDCVRSIGRVEGKLDLLLLADAERDKRTAILERRVSSVERKVWYGSGVAAAVTLFLGKFVFFPH